jgi:hypothetical protein
MSVSLAITVGATLIPTKANAASLKMTALDGLVKNPGDSITFSFILNPFESNPLPPDTINRNIISFQSLFVLWDTDELELPVLDIDPPNSIISNASSVGEITFKVRQPLKDEISDIFAVAIYSDSTGTTRSAYPTDSVDVEPVPEPLTIFGTATALGGGVLFKQKSSKKKKANYSIK